MICYQPAVCLSTTTENVVHKHLKITVIKSRQVHQSFGGQSTNRLVCQTSVCECQLWALDLLKIVSTVNKQFPVF